MNTPELRGVEALAAEVDRLSREVRRLQRPGNLGNSAIDSGALTVTDGDGADLLRIGADHAGAGLVEYVAGPTPATPSAPIVTPVVGALAITWDGRLLGEEGQEQGAPADFQHMGVYITQDARAGEEDPFEREAATLTSVITSPTGGTVTVGLGYGRYEVRLVAMSRAGQFSTPSAAVESDVETLLDAPDIAERMAELDTQLEEGQVLLAGAEEAIGELRSRFVFSDVAPTPADAADRPEGTVWTQTAPGATAGTTTEVGRWQLRAGAWEPMSLDPTVIPELLSYLATFQRVNVAQLVATEATMDTATVLKLFAEIFTAKKITAAEIEAASVRAAVLVANAIKTDMLESGAITADKIKAGAVTASSLSADAINGKTISGATITGGSVTGSIVRMDGTGSAAGFDINLTRDVNGAYLGFSAPTIATPATMRVDPGASNRSPRLVLRAPSVAGLTSRSYIALDSSDPAEPEARAVTIGGLLELAGTGIYSPNAMDVYSSKAMVIGPGTGNLTIRGSGNIDASTSAGFRLNQSVTTTSAANVYMSSNGYLSRSTSIRDSKLRIKDLGRDQIDALLNVAPRTWYDRGDAERFAEYESLMMLGVLNEEQEQRVSDLWPGIEALERVPGVIAEEVEAAGATQFVTYERNDMGAKRLTGVAYDRIGTALLGVVKEQREQIADLTARLARLETAVATLTA